MEKIKEIEADNLYVFQGHCCANSSMFRNLEEARYFIEKANKRFVGYLEIKDYILQQDGWTFMCQIESESRILETYHEARKKSKKAKEACTLTEIWRIVSEQFRHFLSQYVKYVNRGENRSGVLVHSSFERFYFEELDEAECYIVDMKEQLKNVRQGNNKYQSNAGHWEEAEGDEKGSIYLCCKDLDGCEEFFWGEGLGCMDLRGLESIDVLRHLVNKTFSSHSTKIQSQFQPKLE